MLIGISSAKLAHREECKNTIHTNYHTPKEFFVQRMLFLENPNFIHKLCLDKKEASGNEMSEMGGKLYQDSWSSSVAKLFFCVHMHLHFVIHFYY